MKFASVKQCIFFYFDLWIKRCGNFFPTSLNASMMKVDVCIKKVCFPLQKKYMSQHLISLIPLTMQFLVYKRKDSTLQRPGPHFNLVIWTEKRVIFLWKSQHGSFVILFSQNRNLHNFWAFFCIAVFWGCFFV